MYNYFGTKCVGFHLFSFMKIRLFPQWTGNSDVSPFSFLAKKRGCLIFSFYFYQK